MTDLLVHVEHAGLASVLRDAFLRLSIGGIRLVPMDHVADLHIAGDTQNLRLGAVIDWMVARRDAPHQALPDMIDLAGGVLVPAVATFTRKKIATRLTDKELDLLVALYQAPDRTVTKTDLLQNVWGYVEGLETHTLETHIYRLRQKIEIDPARPAAIMTSAGAYHLKVT